MSAHPYDFDLTSHANRRPAFLCYNIAQTRILLVASLRRQRTRERVARRPARYQFARLTHCAYCWRGALFLDLIENSAARIYRAHVGGAFTVQCVRVCVCVASRMRFASELINIMIHTRRSHVCVSHTIQAASVLVVVVVMLEQTEHSTTTTSHYADYTLACEAKNRRCVKTRQRNRATSVARQRARAQLCTENSHACRVDVSVESPDNTHAHTHKLTALLRCRRMGGW